MNEIISIAACEICAHLAEIETSYHKYDGRDENITVLPPIVELLVLIGHGEFRQCPLCGTYYHYTMSYDYFVNGAEEDETLTRLTPTQARRFLTEAQYDQLISAQAANLQDLHPLNRSYAAKCLTAHHLAQNNLEPIRNFLLNPDDDICRGALFWLAQLTNKSETTLAALITLQAAFETLRQKQDEKIALCARVILIKILESQSK